jgi:hypothetical protein
MGLFENQCLNTDTWQCTGQKKRWKEEEGKDGRMGGRRMGNNNSVKLMG